MTNTTQGKHTPGPWHPPSMGLAVFANKRVLIARIASDGSEPKAPPRSEADANARLIAAAPELFAACKRLVTGCAENSDAIISQACAMAKAAIMTAEGNV